MAETTQSSNKALIMLICGALGFLLFRQYGPVLLDKAKAALPPASK